MKMSTRSLLLVAVLGMLLAGTATGPREDVTLATSQSSYEQGDTVYFTLSNGTDSILAVPYIPPWKIFEASTDSLVMPLYVFWAFYYLGPDTSDTFQWDQKDYLGQQVPVGTYYVEVDYSLISDGLRAVVADTFQIIAPTPSARLNWGQIKSEWR